MSSFSQNMEDIQIILQLSERLYAINICEQNIFPKMQFYVLYVTQQSFQQE